MASQGEFNSHEGSPIIRPDDSEDDFEAGFTLQLPVSSTAPEHRIKEEDSDGAWKFGAQEFVDLSAPEPEIKVEDTDKGWKFSSREIVDLSAPEIRIKEEDVDGIWKISNQELIELSDSEHDFQTRDQEPTNSLKLPNDHGQNASQTQGKQAGHDHNQQGDKNGNTDQVLPQEIMHEQNPIDRWNIDAAEKEQTLSVLVERALEKILGGGTNLLNNLQPLHQQTSGTDEVDPNAWMNATVDSDTDPEATFAAAKKEYKTKRRAGKAGWIEEIRFKQAENAEEARLKRLELDLHNMERTVQSENIDEDSDADLFVSQGPKSSLKRPYHMTMEDDDGEDNGGAEADDEDLSGNNVTKGAKATSKRKHAKDVDAEFARSLLAGMEEDLARDKKKKGQRRASTKSKGAKAHKDNLQPSKGQTINKTGKKNKARKQRKAKKPTSHGNGCLDNINSLLDSNVYEDANNNLGSYELPTVTSKDKQKALTALIANVPQEEKRGIRGERAHILRCIKRLGSIKIQADGAGLWKMKGMLSSLHHHQIVGAAWMRERETGTTQPLGGLQADQMGFGKTLMTIATVLANPPGPHDSKCTLIVCTPAILTQWMDELVRHVERGILPQVFRYQASTSKVTFGRECEFLLSNANIVLTTYQEVVRSYPKYSPPKELLTPEQKAAWWTTLFKEKRDLLHKIHFFRVVLDEAQVIKNHKSHTSIACRALMAKHRWAMSGTPIHNSLEELFPYFKFLRVKHTGTFEIFRENFCDPEHPDSTGRLHTFLSQIMLRRTHKDRLFGAPIVPMPENTQITHLIEFNVVERAIYEAVKHRYIAQINNRSRAGTLEKGYGNILTMLLRLRQLTAHPFMLQDTIENLFELEDIQKIWDLCASEVNADQNPARDMLATMRKMIQAHQNPVEIAQEPNEETVTPTGQEEDADADESPPVVFKFRKFLRELAKSSKWAELIDRSLCHRCRDQPDDPWVTDCGHVYCHECIASLAFDAAEMGETQSACLECGHIFASSHPCKGIEELEMRGGSSSSPTRASRQKKDPDEDMRWINVEGKLLPSSKTAAVQAQIEEWLKEDPEKKIIIFSQFLTLMKVLERICEQKNWGHCMYHGKMSIAARDKAIEDFRMDPVMKIMVASLKCGGVGLNLTMASRVICVDLWWNDSVEQQAFCRVFRIGQVSKTQITRFVVKNTVDEKLQQMQLVKAKKIGAAIDDSKMLEKLSMDELLRLFGTVEHDGDNKPFILVDDDYDFEPLLPRGLDELESDVLPPRHALPSFADFDQSNID